MLMFAYVLCCCYCGCCFVVDVPSPSISWASLELVGVLPRPSEIKKHESPYLACFAFYTMYLLTVCVDGSVEFRGQLGRVSSLLHHVDQTRVTKLSGRA